jgi:hypothetical protein
MPTREGPTPSGGVRSVAYLTDAFGAPTEDPAAAVAAEFVEYDAGGNEIARTYGRTDHPPSAVPSDMDDEAMDATKGTWDVTISEDGQYRPVTTLDELSRVMERDALGEAAFRGVLAGMLVLPVWESMPAGLRAEVNAFLEAGRPQ